jgi:hypothetical protein
VRAGPRAGHETTEEKNLGTCLTMRGRLTQTRQEQRIRQIEKDSSRKLSTLARLKDPREVA